MAEQEGELQKAGCGGGGGGEGHTRSTAMGLEKTQEAKKLKRAGVG